MTGYQVALVAIALLLGVIAGFATSLLTYIDRRKVATAILAGGAAFIAVVTAAVTVGTSIQST